MPKWIEAPQSCQDYFVEHVIKICLYNNKYSFVIVYSYVKNKMTLNHATIDKHCFNINRSSTGASIEAQQVMPLLVKLASCLGAGSCSGCSTFYFPPNKLLSSKYFSQESVLCIH